MINNILLTDRHNYTLYLRCYNLVVAPRCFVINNNVYFVHITDNCESVEIFTKITYINNTSILVLFRNCLKLYSNSKGLYFNFPYYCTDYNGRKILKVYICD